MDRVATITLPACLTKIAGDRVRAWRVTLLLAAVWLVAMVDLVHTLSQASSAPWFVETNPLAAALLAIHPLALIPYKLGLLSLATAALGITWRQALTEAGCWVAFGVHAYLAVHWACYYETMLA